MGTRYEVQQCSAVHVPHVCSVRIHDRQQPLPVGRERHRGDRTAVDELDVVALAAVVQEHDMYVVLYKREA